jgi:hypothetical protein
MLFVRGKGLLGTYTRQCTEGKTFLPTRLFVDNSRNFFLYTKFLQS